MENISGSSLYDSLNKFVIGFLLILPFLTFSCFPTSDFTFFCVVVLSWLAGLFLWVIVECITVLSSQRIPVLSSNNETSISDTFDRVIKKWNVSEQGYDGSLRSYFCAYYQIQEKGILGNVPILESFSAFFKNLIFVALVWIVLVVFKWCGVNLLVSKFVSFAPTTCMDEIMHSSICPCAFVMGLLTLSVIFGLIRIFIERKIHTAVWEAALLSGHDKMN